MAKLPLRHDPGGSSGQRPADDVGDGRGHRPGDAQAGVGVGAAEQRAGGVEQHVRVGERGGDPRRRVGDMGGAPLRVGEQRDVQLHLKQPTAGAGYVEGTADTAPRVLMYERERNAKWGRLPIPTRPAYSRYWPSSAAIVRPMRTRWESVRAFILRITAAR